MEISDKTSIKQMFQGMIGIETQILQGIVKQANPLKIQIVNDEKLIITDVNTIVPWHLTDYETKCTISEGTLSGMTTVGGSPAHTHGYQTFTDKEAKLKVFNALKVDDKVHILATNHGKQYFVLDRVAE